MRDLLVKLVRERTVREKVGGGGQIRTVDAADMSRADSESNLLDLLTEILLEASDGDNSQG